MYIERERKRERETLNWLDSDYSLWTILYSFCPCQQSSTSPTTFKCSFWNIEHFWLCQHELWSFGFHSFRPSRQFVPASERYPAPLQRNRQESRLKRQAELLALQERTCVSRSIPPAAPQHQEPRLCPSITQTRTSPTRRVRGSVNL